MEDRSDTTDSKEGRRRQLSGWGATLLKERRARRLNGLERVLRGFSPGERVALYLLTTILGLSTLIMLAHLNADASVSIPAQGGSITEGEVGTARFINPLLTMSQPDQDLTALVYSGLVRALPDGTVVPDLAVSYTVSSDGRIYTFKLRPNAPFQDGSKLTAADVLFTVQEAQDPQINSPRRADWVGVVASSPDASTVVFTLPHAYAPFIQNATLGILPKSLWQNVSAEEFPFSPLNTHPVGSGPYKISKVATDSTGAASRYDLVPFNDFALGSPYVSRISFVFFPSMDAVVKALNAGQIDAAAGIAPSDLANVKRNDAALAKVALPRTFGVFFNQSHNPVLADASVRQALDASVDKQAIIGSSLRGFAAVLDGPIPPGLLGEIVASTPLPLPPVDASAASSTQSVATLVSQARALLQSGGWTWDAKTTSWTKNKKVLSFTLATADQSELVATARSLAADWQAVGIKVSVQVYPLSELNTSVIRPRNYDALLFGEVVGPELDLYAFWHSSQRNDPGLNLSMYANSKTDAILTQARATTDEQARDKLYEQFASLLVKDYPAIFLYAPDFLYVVPGNVHGVELGALTSPADRFSDVYEWYIETEYVWAIFAPLEASPQSQDPGTQDPGTVGL